MQRNDTKASGSVWDDPPPTVVRLYNYPTRALRTYVPHGLGLVRQVPGSAAPPRSVGASVRITKIRLRVELLHSKYDVRINLHVITVDTSQ